MPSQRLHLSLPRAERPPLFRAEMKVSLALSAALALIGTVALLRGPEIVDLVRPSAPDRAPVIATAPAGDASPGSAALARLALADPAATATRPPRLSQPAAPGAAPRLAAAPPPSLRETPRAVSRSIRPSLRPVAPILHAAVDPAATAVDPATVTPPVSEDRAALARSPVPRLRPAVARRAGPGTAPGAEVVATRLLPAPAALSVPEAEVRPVAFETTLPAPRSGGVACSDRLARDIPRRSPNASPASRLVEGLGGTAGDARDRAFTEELLAGNMPGFLRRLTPVSLSGRKADGAPVTVTICVTPDYLAVGNDTDYFRVPLSLPAAARVADRFGFMLPTTRMVDAIFQQAGTRVAPSPMTPGAAMTSTNYFWRHNQTVEGQLQGRAGTLVAGIKKDLVLSERLRRNPGRVAIYGWHRANGTPIQPLSTVHGAYYADYSHGVRLVSRTAYVNGRTVALADILSDPNYAGFLSDEGPIRAPDLLMAALYR